MKPVSVIFIGIQEGCKHIRAFPLYRLREPLGIYPVGSTVSLATINAHGCMPAVYTCPTL